MSFGSFQILSCQVLLTAALTLGGCAGHSNFMAKAPAPSASDEAPESAATIVFVRDSGMAFAVNFSIIDHVGNFLGDAVSRAHFTVSLPPGRYFFLARGGETTGVVQADVAAGSIYYVRVVPHLGVWLAGVELDPIKPNEKEWTRLAGWLQRTHRLWPVTPKVPANTSATPLPPWASEAWAALSVEERAARSLAPTDGLSLHAAEPVALRASSADPR